MVPPLNVQLIRSRRRRKTLSLRIEEDGRVVLSVPYRTPKGEVQRFLREKEAWILQKVSEREERIRENRKAFVPGERFLFLGESYPLEIRNTDCREPPLTFSSGKFILGQGYADRARDLFIEWYKREAKEIIVKRVNSYSQKLFLFPKSIRITSARSRWGSCSRGNRLSFSWRVILAPLAIVDYILIHELAHIKEKNHSRPFWRYVESILPDYRERRIWLKENGHRLGL